MAEDDRPPGSHVIDESIPVDVVEARALRPLHEEGSVVNGHEGPHGAVHAAGYEPSRLFTVFVRSRLYHFLTAKDVFLNSLRLKSTR